MEIVIAAGLLAGGLVVAAILFARGWAGPPRRYRAAGPADAARLATLEERLNTREETMATRESELRERAVTLDKRDAELVATVRRVEDRADGLERDLERVGGLTAAQAKQVLLKQVEDRSRHDAARLVRQIDEETKRDADRRVRNILSACMGRIAAGHATETTVSVVQLPADDMKGRIIGREGRNIRALENLTGVDFIIDDTPHAVVLSSFDGVRREIARLTLEKLIEDGRIHPARIEETYYQAKSELDDHIHELGEQAVLEAKVEALDPELVRLMGRLRFRTSYGQNVLAHSIECAHLAAMMADELGASARTASGGAAARHRQGRLARDRGAARAGRRATWRAATASPRPSPTPWRPTTTRSSPRPSRRSSSSPPTRCRARAPARAASRSSRTSSGCATSSSLSSAIQASTASTPCRPAARCG